MKEFIKRIPILGGVATRLYWGLRAPKRGPESFPGSAAYWEKRYAGGGNSGVGSYARFAQFKAEVLNRFVTENGLHTVIEFGCGDGNQLSLATYPRYLGFDVSSTVVSQCRERFKGDCYKSFHLMNEYKGELSDLALSLDVIYHLVEDDVYAHYMRTLFQASTRYVIIYASDSDDNRGYEGSYIKHRKFTTWIHDSLPNWKLIDHVPNRYPYRGDYRKGSFADFFIYQKADRASPSDRPR